MSNVFLIDLECEVMVALLSEYGQILDGSWWLRWRCCSKLLGQAEAALASRDSAAGQHLAWAGRGGAAGQNLATWLYPDG